MHSNPSVKLRSYVELTESDPPWHILRLPKSRLRNFGFKGNLRRVVCTLNGTETFHCSLFPSRGDYFITLNKELRRRLGLDPGDAVVVELAKDDSKFGMPMPPEFAEVLRQDPDGKRLFNALLPGSQKLMLKMIIAVRDVDKRIARALAGIELLKRTGGRFDYHAQRLAMTAGSSASGVPGRTPLEDE
jgi:bifunctional DNA-binding transcriptional regulator/antitoxin component of YhaV-PrlF toxin-antitoxin module